MINYVFVVVVVVLAGRTYCCINYYMPYLVLDLNPRSKAMLESVEKVQGWKIQKVQRVMWLLATWALLSIRIQYELRQLYHLDLSYTYSLICLGIRSHSSAAMGD